jgi:DNA adenine methylase
MAEQKSVRSRPIMRYHGGKWRLAPWIIEHFPAHRCYVEPFGGAASVLMRKPRSYAEVYNDLDNSLVALFLVLRDPALAAELERVVRLTPFARAEFEAAYEHTAEPVEAARRLLVRAAMGFGSAAANRQHRTGFRGNTTRSGSTPASDWGAYPDLIASFTDRLRGVVIERAEAATVLAKYDSRETLHYVDPPYPHGTRSFKARASGQVYNHEMSDDDHRALAAVLHSLEGMVVLSGYACELYDRDLFADWHRVERDTHADGARPRTEVLWLNPVAVRALWPQLNLGVA